MHFLRISVRLILFTVLLVSHAVAQPLVVVSEIKQVVRIAPSWRSVLNDESFPDYFRQDSLLRLKVMEQIGQLLQQKWSGAPVKFTQPDGITLLRSAQPVLPMPALPKERAEGDVFVAIVQVTSPTTTATDESGMPVVYFTHVCQVRAEDKAGKLVWESRITQPFSTAVKPGSTYGEVEVSKSDWEKLFVSSLAAALESSSKRLPTAAYYRPPYNPPQFTDFLSKAHAVTLHESIRNGLLYRKGEARKIRYSFGEGKGADGFELDQQFIGNTEMPSGLLLTRASLTNMNRSQVYQITAEFALPEGRVMPVAERRQQSIAIRCTVEGLVAGRFTLTAQSMEGQWGYDVYTIRKTPLKHTFEIRLNDQLIAIAQKGGINTAAENRSRETYLMVEPDLEEGATTEMEMVWLVYQMAYQFGQDFLEY